MMSWALARHGVIAVNEPGDGVVMLTGAMAERIAKDATREMAGRRRELASFARERAARAQNGPR